jgi:two-component system, cell cycle response regulator
MNLNVPAEPNSIRTLAAAIGRAHTPLKVLVAEDNPFFQSMLRGMLTGWGYDVTMAHDGLEAWQLLETRDAPRLAVLDWMMPGLDGVDICRRVRAAPREPYTYIILLTARTETGDLVEGMDAGADDYLTKPLKAHELRVRLNAGRRIIELQEQLLEAHEELRVQAARDDLTGLLNRRAILKVLEDEIARAGREWQPVGALMMDLDFFKKVNDTQGHLAGDAVLHEAAQRIQASIRRYDSVGRYGGEEFLFVLPGCDLAGACMEAERVREAVAARPFAVSGEPVSVTCSIGVACRERETAWNANALLREADRSLYLAKNQGRNRVVATGLRSATGELPVLITSPS